MKRRAALAFLRAPASEPAAQLHHAKARRLSRRPGTASAGAGCLGRAVRAPSVRADSTYVIEALRRLCRGHAVVQVSGRLVGAPGAAEKPHSSLPQSAESRGAFSQPVVARAAARLDPPPTSGARAWQRQAPLRRWQVCSSPKPGEEDWRASPSAEAAAARRVGTFREGKRNEISLSRCVATRAFPSKLGAFPSGRDRNPPN